MQTTNIASDTPDSIREHTLPNGSIAVTEHWVHGVKGAVTIGVDDPWKQVRQVAFGDDSPAEPSTE